jgi:hypothetical protein
MKNSFKLLSVSLLCFITVHIYAQSTISSGISIQGLLNAVPGPLSAIVVPTDAVLSYLPSGWTTGYTSDEGNPGGFICYQSFSGVSQTFNVVTIWAVTSNLTTAETMPLEVEIFNASETSATLPTAVPVVQTTSTVIPVATDQQLSGSYNIYSYTIQIPSTNMSSGWISVHATNATVHPVFFWLNTTTAPANSCYQTNFGIRTVGLSLSLRSSSPVPVSKWAIMASFLLITGLVSFRFFRRTI